MNDLHNFIVDRASAGVQSFVIYQAAELVCTETRRPPTV